MNRAPLIQAQYRQGYQSMIHDTLELLVEDNVEIEKKTSTDTEGD